jgi:protein-ribulosamine 3-kinase
MGSRTGGIRIFDSCAYYVHHEMAIGKWHVDHHHIKAKEYRNECFK